MDLQKITVVEDDEGLREMIRTYLNNKGYAVNVVEDGKEALTTIQASTPDLVLLDVTLPDMDGFSVCKEIRKTSTVPIIFLTVHRGIESKLRGFEVGADDYLTKPFNFIELEARIRANLKRYDSHKTYEKKKIVYNGLEIDLTNYTCYIDEKPIDLTIKEMELLILLAKHSNQIWKQEQLYEHVWGNDRTNNVNTVKVHISRLRKKIEKNPAQPKYIKTVRGMGYKFAGSPEE